MCMTFITLSIYVIYWYGTSTVDKYKSYYIYYVFTGYVFFGLNVKYFYSNKIMNE